MFLDRKDWKSGTIAWLLDIIAPNEATARQLIWGLHGAIKAEKLHVHPVVQKFLKGFVAEKAMVD